jgi:hypothetical protein
MVMKTKKWSIALFGLLALTLLLPAQENNDFYDNEPFIDLPLGPIEVAGEVVQPGKADLATLPLRTVMVREARLENGKPAFVGSYVFQGYSLFDILRERIVKKKNEKEFSSVIDLFVVVENKKGDRAVFSWGEIFYPTVPHRVLVAAKAAIIIPSMTKERWPLPTVSKVVAANDLVSERNLDDPIRITVLSPPLSFAVEKGKSPLISASAWIVDHGREVGKISRLPESIPLLTLPSVFYGRGKGFHGISYFEGALLRMILKDVYPAEKQNLKRDYLVLAGEDGYRAVFSASEVFNRNDNGEFLVCDRGKEDGGRFSIYPGPDFFSDRAVKALKEIHFLTIE